MLTLAYLFDSATILYSTRVECIIERFAQRFFRCNRGELSVHYTGLFRTHFLSVENRRDKIAQAEIGEQEHDNRCQVSHY
jgi:hypothetical protein